MIQKEVVTPAQRQLDDFSQRLNEALNAEGFPKKGEGRQQRLKSLMSVSQNSARKWLEAKGMPDTKKLTKLCSLLQINLTWLVSGVGNMRSETSDSVSNHELDATSKVAQSVIREIIKVDKAYGGIPASYGKLIKEVLQTVKENAKKRS